MVEAVFSATATRISTGDPALAPWAVRAWAVTVALPWRMPLKTHCSFVPSCMVRQETLFLSLVRAMVELSSAAVP